MRKLNLDSHLVDHNMAIQEFYSNYCSVAGVISHGII